MSIPAKKVIAIVGPSGSGKSTLFSLLQKYYIPNSGTITISNEDILGFNTFQLREHIGYVSQDVPIIDGTIRENVLYGIKQRVSDEVLEDALIRSNSASFIKKFDDGLETLVGEKGIKLSGGQKQRLSIARLIIKKSPIVLLDEATSNLDPETELAIQDGIHNVVQDRTTIIIAHRLSTVVNADKIYVIEEGVVTGIGTHANLIENNLFYKKFALNQNNEVSISR